MISLYQLAGSHYCEKVHWALDYKKLLYTTINLIPGPHVKRIKRIAKTSQVPVLIDGNTVEQRPFYRWARDVHRHYRNNGAK